MKPEEDELNRVFWTAWRQLGELTTFYSIMLAGLPHGVAAITLETEGFAEELYKDGTLASLLVEPEKVDEFYEIMKEHKQQVFKKNRDDAKRSLDAAAIVSAHGILDACVYGYLEVLSLAFPDSFTIYTERKKVDLSEVKLKSYDELHKDKIKKFMEGTVDRESLIYKLDKLHEVANPRSTLMNPEHNYDRERLEKFNKARHDIVHGNSWRSYSIDFTKEFYYWNLLNSYLLRLVVQKTGLKISQEGGNKYFLEL
ncbi:hypothetical protein ACFL3Q_05625 [Planctomycetota bacterium]